MKSLILTALMACAAAVTLTAQTANQQRLQKATNVACEFVLMTSADWARDGAPNAAVKPATLKLGYTNVNTDDGSADVVGTTSASSATAELPIITRYHNGFLHFMQVTSPGELYTTTIYDQPARTATPTRMKAVHSRHSWQAFALPGYPSRPEQYYGECEVS
jgi:hypothetical protein